MKNFRIEIKWAIIFSIVGLLWMLLEKIGGLHGTYIQYHQYLTNLYAIPAIWVMVLALNDKKKNFYGGKMSYFQGLITGIIISVIIALLSPITQWITSYIISPEYFPNIIKHSIDTGYYKTIEAAQATFNFENYLIQGLIGALIMGIVTSAVVMIFLRTKKNLNT